MNHILAISTGGDLIHNFRGPAHDYILSELDRRKGELRTQLVWIGAQKEPGFTARVWKWVNGKCHYDWATHKCLLNHKSHLNMDHLNDLFRCFDVEKKTNMEKSRSLKNNVQCCLLRTWAGRNSNFMQLISTNILLFHTIRFTRVISNVNCESCSTGKVFKIIVIIIWLN